MQDLILKNVNIYKGDGAYINRGYIIIRDSKIFGYGELSQYSSNDISCNIYDCDGLWITPGFIDCHVHACWSGNPDLFKSLNNKSDSYICITMLKNLQSDLMSGFTSIRDLGSPGTISIEVKNAINEGICIGPRVMTSGQPLTMTGGHTWFISKEIDGLSEARKATRQSIKEGVDLIKAIATGGVLSPGMEPGSDQLSIDELSMIVDEAHKQSKKVTVHAIGEKGILNSLHAGVDCIEHGVFLNDEAIDIMLEKDIFLVPTLSAVDTMIRFGERNGLPEYAINKAKYVYDIHRKSVNMAIERGVKVCFGTDAGTPFNFHGENNKEFSLLHEMGMSVDDCMSATTTHAAMCLGLDDSVGKIEEGYYADLIGFDENPTKSITSMLCKPSLIIKNGEFISNSNLLISQNNLDL